MIVTKADFLGFCYGVKRAVSLVEKEVQEGNGAIYTYGPIIHNPQQVERFQKSGIMVTDEVPEQGTIIIRSHGAGPEFYKMAQKNELCIIDGTCPDVKKLQSIAKDAGIRGNFLIIIGDHRHPEVIAVTQWAGNNHCVICDMSSVEQIIIDDSYEIEVVTQTTFEQEKYCDIINKLRIKFGYRLIEHKTICNSSKKRQDAARELAKKVDAMVVVGGKNSANTEHLAEICREVCGRVQHIEIADELNDEWFVGIKACGLTAGASTPDWLIDEVYCRLMEIKGD